MEMQASEYTSTVALEESLNEWREHNRTLLSMPSAELQTKKHMKALSRFHKGFGSIPLTTSNRQIWNRRSKTYEWKDCINEYILVTLTTPESFGGNLNDAWRLFRLKLSRRGHNFPYFAVREFNEKRTAEHLHVVFRTVKVDYKTLQQCWTQSVNYYLDQNINNVWFHVDWLQDQKGIANYLAKYIFKEYENGRNLRKYWYSQDWIYCGHSRHSKEMYLANYKPVLTLEGLRQLDKQSRLRQFLTDYHYILCFWYNQYTRFRLTPIILFDIIFRLRAITKEINRLNILLERYDAL